MKPEDFLVIDKSNQYAFFPCEEWKLINNIPNPYSHEYVEKYKEYEETDLGKRLTTYRIDLVNSYTEGSVLDIGIGSGHFIRQRNSSGVIKTYGFDIRLPQTVELLAGKNTYRNPYKDMSFAAITFWDSFEHIAQPSIIIKDRDIKFVFMTIPIYDNIQNVYTSKHFRPTEHYHYFTEYGIQSFMSALGFNMVKRSNFECSVGREGVMTYVFKSY